VFRQGRWAITPNQVSPFGNPRIDVWLPTPRGLSQAPTSFFGSWCQGIHRVPLSTWQLQMMLASTVQFSRYGRSRSSLAVRRAGAGPYRGSPLRPFPQDPTACSACAPLWQSFRVACATVLTLPELVPRPNNQCSTSELPPQDVRLRCGSGRYTSHQCG
jgi:hypothetical protein